VLSSLPTVWVITIWQNRCDPDLLHATEVRSLPDERPKIVNGHYALPDCIMCAGGRIDEQRVREGEAKPESYRVCEAPSSGDLAVEFWKPSAVVRPSSTSTELMMITSVVIDVRRLVVRDKATLQKLSDKKGRECLPEILIIKLAVVQSLNPMSAIQKMNYIEYKDQLS
jgi:hypothetical protein